MNAQTSLEITIQIQLNKLEGLKKYVPSVIPYNSRLSVYDSSVPSILHESPSLLSIAVYFGAKDVFDFLISNGALVDTLDNVHFYIFFYHSKYNFISHLFFFLNF